jgi:hypothetical protein
MVLPVYFDRSIVQRAATFLPIVATTVESMKPYSLFLLFLAGFGITFFSRAAPFWLLGLSTIVALPLWSTLDMALGSSSHNLWPIEWMFYVFYSMFGVIGAAFAVALRRRFLSRTQKRG